jgi:hypothetical protein
MKSYKKTGFRIGSPQKPLINPPKGGIDNCLRFHPQRF